MVSNLEARASRLDASPDDTVLSVSQDVSELQKTKLSSFRAPARSVRIQNLTERVFSAKPHVNELSEKDPYEIVHRNLQNEILRTQESEQKVKPFNIGMTPVREDSPTNCATQMSR